MSRVRTTQVLHKFEQKIEMVTFKHLAVLIILKGVFIFLIKFKL